MVSTTFKRAWLRALYAALEAPGTLLEALTGENSAWVAKGVGPQVSATSGNGHSVTLSVPGQGSHTNVDMAEMCEEMLTLYDVAVANGAITDALRYGEMMGLLQPLTEQYSDYSMLRYA